MSLSRKDHTTDMKIGKGKGSSQVAQWWRICLTNRRPEFHSESGRSPGEGNDNLIQYSCQENPINRKAWQATIHGVTKSQTQLSDWHTHTHAHTHTRPCTSCMFKLKRGFFWRGITGSGHVLRMVSHRNRKGFGQAWDRRTRQRKFI